MNNESARAVSTAAVWISTAVIMTFGLFRMNGEFLFFFLGMAILAGAAVGATFAIWQERPPTTSSAPSGGTEKATPPG